MGFLGNIEPDVFGPFRGCEEMDQGRGETKR